MNLMFFHRQPYPCQYRWRLRKPKAVSKATKSWRSRQALPLRSSERQLSFSELRSRYTACHRAFLFAGIRTCVLLTFVCSKLQAQMQRMSPRMQGPRGPLPIHLGTLRAVRLVSSTLQMQAMILQP